MPPRLTGTYLPIEKGTSADYENLDEEIRSVPGGQPARCNPVTAPADCTAEDIENPSHLESR